MAAKRVSIAKLRTYALSKAAHSHMLWLHVNRAIAHILGKHRSRAQIAAMLDGGLGPETKDEPVSLRNYREAARAVRRGTDMVLI